MPTYQLTVEVKAEPKPGTASHFAALIANDYRIIKDIKEVTPTDNDH